MTTNGFISCEYENVINSEITNNNNIKDKINSIIGKSSLSKNKSLNKEIVLDSLRNEGVVDFILSNLLSRTKIQNQSSQHVINDRALLNFTHEQLAPPGPGQFIGINVMRGANFADHLLVDHNTNVNDKFEFGLHQPNEMQKGFQFFLSYQKQRICSKMIPCVRDPLINQQFFIKLTDGEPDNTSVSTLLGLREPLHLVLIKHDFMTHERWLVSSQVIEWRMVLCSESWSTRINMDLQGVFDESKVNVGSIEVVLQLVPTCHRQLPIAQDVFNAQLRMENVTYGSEKERKFLVYAKQWWQEFKTEHEEDERPVKIFAQDENGLNRFVCDYVSPVRAGRILDSPAQAARFVASISTQLSSSIGSNTAAHDIWKSGLAFLVENRGNVDNHSVLLCSLLLGFGMNAYVAVGVVKDDFSGQRPHSWVVTFQEEQPNKAIFWEASTGKKFSFRAFPHYSPPSNCKVEYVTIGCIFNHYQFFANNYKTKSIETCIFDLNNANRWKRMSEEIIAIVVDNKYFEKAISGDGNNNISWNNRIPLSVSRLVASTSDVIKMSNDLENQLRTLVSRWRSARLGTNVTSKWDDQLCYMLGQALFSYELEQLTGLSNVGNDEFKSSIQRHVKDGYTFKAFPVHVLHINARLILDTALKSPIFQEIINCRGSDVNLALRVKVFSYAEHSTPTWVIFGCFYQFSQ